MKKNTFEKKNTTKKWFFLNQKVQRKKKHKELKKT